MKTTGVSCETKFGLLVFLGHPNGEALIFKNNDEHGVKESHQMVSAENVENFPKNGRTPNQKFAQNKVLIFVSYFRLTQDLTFINL